MRDGDASNEANRRGSSSQHEGCCMLVTGGKLETSEMLLKCVADLRRAARVTSRLAQESMTKYELHPTKEAER